jgi:hypothetical protein
MFDFWNSFRTHFAHNIDCTNSCATLFFAWNRTTYGNIMLL